MSSRPPAEAPTVGSGSSARNDAVREMNRGFALSARGEGDEAIAAYARAIDLFRPLPLHEHPDWANSLGAALMNHGQLLHRMHGLARASDALNSFAEAIRVLTAIPADSVQWAHRNLAGTYINRANLLLDLAAKSGPVPRPARPEPQTRAEAPRDLNLALTDAASALALVAPAERTALVSADLALKARRVHCDALGQLLVVAAPIQQDVHATAAAELVDDALALIRFWTGRGEHAFADLAVRFFRFGTELCRQHQPHFLVEFIEENLAVAPTCADELRAIAHLALDAALGDGAAPALHTFDDPVSERALVTRVDLATARARLNTASLDPDVGAASAAIRARALSHRR